MSHFLFLLLFFQLLIFIQSTYRAGVVEYEVRRSEDIYQLIEDNLARYQELISQAATQAVDILVFPEETLNYAYTTDRSAIVLHALHVPEPSDSVAPCDNDIYGNVVKQLSCYARNASLYVVVNMSEKVACNTDSLTQTQATVQRECPQDGYYLFNSNVVFDRNGSVVSRYRKTNMFGEVAFDQTDQPDLQSFTTDFGVEFGHMISFDMQFSMPSAPLLQSGVHNFVLSILWYSALPFLTGVQWQAAWAYSHRVNLLAAGTNEPQLGSTGSGIFSGRNGIKVALITGDKVTRLLVADLNVNGQLDSTPATSEVYGDKHRDIVLLRDHLQYYWWRFVKLDRALQGYQEQICDENTDFCCTVYIKASLYEMPTLEYYRYAVVAFSGVRTFGGFTTGGVQNCGIVPCTGDDYDSCGRSFTSADQTAKHIIFEELRIQGNFKSENATQYPTSLRENFMPLDVQNFTFHIEYDQETGQNVITYNFTGLVDDLLTFAIFSRDYSVDGQPVVERAPFLTVPQILVYVSLVTLLVFICGANFYREGK